MVLQGDEPQVESHLGPFASKIGAQFVPNVPEALKSFWMHPTVLLGDEAQLEARFGPFGASANLNARQVHGLRRKYHRVKNRFGRTRSNSSVMWILRNLILVHLDSGLLSGQDRCMVCAKRTISSEIIVDAPDGTPR
jgi:hypothetical protein